MSEMASPFDTLDRRLQESMHLDSLETPSLPSGYDISQSSASSIPQPSLSYTPKAATPKRPKYSLADLETDDDDINLMMSPPVTMQFTLAPRASEMMATGLTPQKPAHQHDAARRIVDDLVEEMTYVPSPKMPTPDAFRRYSVAPPQSDSRTFHPSPNSTFDSDIDVPETEQHVYDDTFDSTASSISPFDAPGAPQTQFNLYKQDEMLTFFGGNLLEAAGRDVADTPTNARLR
jgi:DASH complex subunit ASK1